MHKNYVFLYLKTGGGHLAPARSIASYINKHSHDATITLADGFLGVNRLIRFLIEDGYRKSQSRALWMFETLYALNKISFIASCTAMITCYFIKPHVKKQLLESNPSQIVVFHFLLIKPVMQIVKECRMNCQVKVVVTDPNTAHPLWFLEKNINYIVFSDQVKRYCMDKGVESDKVVVFPFILNEKFSKPLPADIIRMMRENLGYNPDKKLILILGGGDGMPRGEKILKSLLKNKPQYHIIIVCGTNQRLYRKAWEIKTAYGFDSLTIHGYVEFIYELINVADLVIAKCGASTFMEILLSGKVPVVNNYIWEQEKGNVEFIINNGLGIYEPRISKLPQKIDEILFNRDVYNHFVENIEKQNLNNGTSQVSQYLLTNSFHDESVGNF